MSFRYLACFALPVMGMFAFAAEPQTSNRANIPAINGAGTADAGDDAEDVLDEPATPPQAGPAAEKFWQAMQRFQSSKPEDLASGRQLLQEAADLEYVVAQSFLGNCHVTGAYGFARDERKGAALFRLAAERGDDFAKVSYGQCLFAGTGVRKNLTQAAAWFNAALAADAAFARPIPPAWFVAAQNASDPGVAGSLESDPVSSAQASAHYFLGLIAHGQGDRAAAHAHFVAAATAGPAGRSGIYPAAVQAAMAFAFGDGVPRDAAQARAMLEHSSELSRRMRIAWIHSPVALQATDDFAVADMEQAIADATSGEQASLQMQIASRLGDRNSREYDPAEAVKWYELAAESGQGWAMLSLGLIYGRGELGEPDPVRAFQWFEKAGADPIPKHLLGAANLAICHFNGLGTAKDPAKAAALFTRLKNEDIVCYLGSIGQCPSAPLAYEEELILNLNWATEKKNPHAQYLLGVRYQRGWGLSADEKQARRWFTQAADAGDGAACGILGDYFRQGPKPNIKKAIAYYRTGIEQRDAVSAFGMGYLIETGLDGVFDWNKVAGYYQQALEFDPNALAAHLRLAVLFGDHINGVEISRTAGFSGWNTDRLVGRVDPTDADEAGCRFHLAEAYRLGSEWAALQLAENAYRGRGEAQDFRKAYGYFEDAAERGLSVAHYYLGMMHENGEGVSVTLAEAAYHYRLAALDGHIDSLRRLANFYLTGKGVGEDLDRAGFWLARLASAGEPDALIALGDLALRKGEHANAVRFFRRIAAASDSQLNARACVRLSRCYELGLGVKANSGRARSYRERALRLGGSDIFFRAAGQQMINGNVQEALALYECATETCAAASYALGQLFYFGTHVAQDRPKAWLYLRRAAGEHDRDAMYFLAAATYNREPGAPTLDEALQLAKEAAGAGHAKAADLVRKLERRRDSPPSATPQNPSDSV